jgi:hypothetical protein
MKKLTLTDKVVRISIAAIVIGILYTAYLYSTGQFGQ